MMDYLLEHSLLAVHKFAVDHVLVVILAGALHCLLQAMLSFALTPTKKRCWCEVASN